MSRAVGSELTTEKLAWDHGGASADLGYSLLVVREAHTATHALAAAGTVIIGRSPAAGIRVDDTSISREHARLHLGRPLRIEDLGSSNGTRVRQQPLQPHAPVEIAPGDVIDLGAVLLMVQHRRLSPRAQRTTSLPFVHIRVEEECERADSRFAVAHLTVTGALGDPVVQHLLASYLRAGDLVAVSAPGRYLALLPEITPDAAERLLAAARRQLAERGARVDYALRACPRDGRDCERLLDVRAGKRPAPRPLPSGIIAADEAMLRVQRLVERVADSDLSVLVLGETGSGKEVIAGMVHALSRRAGKPLVKLNCGALAESLIDSELFGYQKGAFTGAAADKVGLLESAAGGTVFLDEIGDMPAATQVRFLRVLESREVMPIGAVRPRAIDVRVVAATHHDLAESVSAGRFREDLYYRLNGISIIVPPLRERPFDIAPLALHFLARAWKAATPPPELSDEALAWLKTHPWPGNVRELRNVIERAAVLCEGRRLEPQHLTLDGRQLAARPTAAAADAARPAQLRDEVRALERERIVRALEACGGSQRRAAVALGLSRGALIRRLQQLGLRPTPRK